ncbi:SRPBCC family protein [Actinomycetes bacterium KLBMP 9759]
MEWTGARYADTPTVEVETWVDASPERVWEVVSDVELMPSMSAEVQRVEWLDGVRGPAKGARFVGYSKHAAFGEWSTTSHVVECEEPKVFSWAVADVEQPSSVWRFTLEPRDGGTALRQWVQMGPGRSGLSFAIDRMPEKEEKIVFVRLREFEQAITGTLAAIKQRVEAA